MPNTANLAPSQSYSVETFGDCTIVRGQLPLAAAGKLMQEASCDAVLDIGLSTRLGAVMAFGPPTSLKALREARLPACDQVERELAAACVAGLSQEAIEWLDGYDRGQSSDALFSVATGVACGATPGAIPKDGSDLGRCIRLWQRVPEVAANLQRAGAISPEWATIIENWHDLVHQHLNGESVCLPGRPR